MKHTLTNMERAAAKQRRALGMINNPNAWPCWPKLPLKRIGSGMTDANHLGYLMELEDSVLPIVYIGNIHMEKHNGTERFTSFRELLAKWEID